MSTRITVEQLEQMKTHELADLLANVVLLLRRLPDVECKQLQRPAEIEKLSMEAGQPPRPSPAPLSQEELKKKTVPELKMLADELHIVYSVRILKEELINRILTRWATGHSEQYTIQNV
jgi:hypothetical protein